MYACTPLACPGPVEASESDSLEQELQMIVSYSVGAGNRTQIWGKSAVLSHLSRP